VPVYDYACSNCGQLTEVIHGIDAPGPRFCPACGAEGTLRKSFAAPAVHFKGSGWAKKDRSRSSASTSRTAGEGAETGSKDGKTAEPTSTSGDSKGEASSTSKAATSSAESKQKKAEA
jgi:putative FmdB family regulatory protein